jgi:DnaJ-class molecular chaperone
MIVVCQTCKGRGYKRKQKGNRPEEPCPDCDGTGLQVIPETLKVVSLITPQMAMMGTPAMAP